MGVQCENALLTLFFLGGKNISKMKEKFKTTKSNSSNIIEMRNILDNILCRMLSFSFLSIHSTDSLSFSHNLRFPDIHSDVTRYDMLHALSLHCVHSQSTYRTLSKLQSKDSHKRVCWMINYHKKAQQQIGVQILTHGINVSTAKKEFGLKAD